MAIETNKEVTRRMVLTAASVCEDKKAEDTRILELDPADSGFTDYFLITSGTNERQTQTIAEEIEQRMKRDFATFPNSVEGKRRGEWILLDYVDFVVHVFLAERRAFYDIERLRKSATPVDIAQLKAALSEKVAAVRKKTPAKAAAKRETVAKKAPARKAPARKTAAKKATAKKTAKKTAAKKKTPKSSSARKPSAGKRTAAKKTSRAKQ
ncbi:MAG: ribosome silencing factor [Acidobacteriaceae bacterium]